MKGERITFVSSADGLLAHHAARALGASSSESHAQSDNNVTPEPAKNPSIDQVSWDKRDSHTDDDTSIPAQASNSTDLAPTPAANLKPGPAGPGRHVCCAANCNLCLEEECRADYDCMHNGADGSSCCRLSWWEVPGDKGANVGTIEPAVERVAFNMKGERVTFVSKEEAVLMAAAEEKKV